MPTRSTWSGAGSTWHCAAGAADALSTPSGGLRPLGRELLDEPSDTDGDLVADPAHAVEVEAGGVLELPVLVALPRVDRAGVAAAHRDHHVGGLHGRAGQRLRVL